MIATHLEKELKQGANISIISFVNCLIEDAYHLRASDVHLDPEDDKIQIRFRIDGVLQDIHSFGKDMYAEVMSRIKIIAHMRTDEHQSAQDGRFRYFLKENNKAIDVRVSVVPTFYGENSVMRLLVDQAEDFSLEALGFSKENAVKITNAVHKPYGMILATGPTGSGKTTTLYTLIRTLNKRSVSIITIEDPVEYAIKGINQIQANSRTGLTFANGLRSILRQDPNIIMVGEIRDSETAGVAVNTALTGHLLLSTIHTNDAATTLPRLLDMKIESYLIASTVNVAIGQRLVRKICESCKTEKKVTEAEQKGLAEVLPKDALSAHKKFFVGKGCDDCGKTGYKGRIGVQEVLVIDGPIRDAILRKATADEIQKIAVAQGMVPMIEDAVKKAGAGITTFDEVLRMLHE
ncbi:MAG: type II/IV secretion system protein [Patescibacteria group bacterium]|nr:GspE/PulE family protein [Patescibacteria group bacterium]MDE2015515.1 type II/IV secretion system protein [Patescibacteria group bacterium]MDE2226869.1 type II/IV secretion system protein [Patescibacteria group bacterium]